MTPGEIQEVASALNILRPDDHAMSMWVGALASGDYKTGQGVLRSADDEYDPFGVLAVINHAEWTWSDLDQGWGVGDTAMALDAKMIAKWLDVPSHEQMRGTDLMKRVKDFQDLILRVSDSGVALSEIGELLRQGIARAAEERTRQEATRYQSVVGLGSMRARASLHPYYGKRR